MHWQQTVFELIDLRSFSNLWYWIALAVVWSTSSHWVIGIPNDLIQRARRGNGRAAADVADLMRINARRYLHIARVAGLWIAGFGACAFTVLAILGFGYGVEFCQALFLLLGPVGLVGLLTVRTALRFEREAPEGAALYRLLRRHRLGVQAMGLVAIFVTAMWGMWWNMSISVLGG